MRSSKKEALLFTILLIACSFTGFTATAADDGEGSIECEETKWWENWYRDKNHNKIDDQIENMAQDEECGIFINYEGHPDEKDVERLSELEIIVKYVYKYIDVICARNVAISEVEVISRLPNVVMVKLEPKIYPALDVSARAIKARESDDYSPYTAEDIGPYTGEGISIAILDTGVDDGGFYPNQHHESVDDLDDVQTTTDPKRIAGVDFTQEETILTPRDGTYDPDDTNGHGTHCAGIAMGTGGTDDVYVGMAPQARLVDVRVMENVGLGNTGEIMAGIEWCIDNKNQYDIRVLSLSIGSFTDSDGSDEAAQTVNRAVEAGLVVVAGMGNDGERFVPHWAAADGAIAVGSVDDKGTVNRNDDTLSSFSNTGPRLDDGDDDKMDELKPDVVAYGDGIMAAQANTADGYVPKSGTSMATPHVAGVVALMLQANQGLNPEQVKEILRHTAEPRGSPSNPELDPKYNTKYGWGIVDAYEAVNMALGYREVSVYIDSPTNGETVKGTVKISGTASVDTGSVGLVEVSIDDPDFNSYTLTAEGEETWSVEWDTENWNGQRTIYARAISGNYSATTSIEVFVDNPKGSNGDGLLEEDGPPKIDLPFGIGKVSLYAAVAFVVILGSVIILIVAAVLLRRRRMILRMIEARRADQGQR